MGLLVTAEVCGKYFNSRNLRNYFYQCEVESFLHFKFLAQKLPNFFTFASFFYQISQMEQEIQKKRSTLMIIFFPFLFTIITAVSNVPKNVGGLVPPRPDLFRRLWRNVASSSYHHLQLNSRAPEEFGPIYSRIPLEGF